MPIDYGAYGNVLLVKHLVNKEQYAMKVIKFTKKEEKIKELS